MYEFYLGKIEFCIIQIKMLTEWCDQFKYF